MQEADVLRVSGKTPPNKLAGAIVKTLAEVDTVKLDAIGAEPVNQAVKAMIVANTFLAATGKRLDIVPAFGTMKDTEEEITIIRVFLRAIPL